jgi:IclR family acetate operon transcriptional repressor
LLEAVASEPLGLTALAERTGLGASTAYRLLSTLAARGYVTRSEESGHFGVGHKLVELAAIAGRSSERLRIAAQPSLRELRDKTDETANLVVRDGLAVVYIDQVESSRTVRMFTTIGRRVPLHACAGGKAILALAPPETVDAIVEAGLERRTPRTLCTRSSLLDDLELTRQRGFAVDNEEYEEGVVCIAAAIMGTGTEAVAAATVSGPASRMLERDLAALGELVHACAARISGKLGAHVVLF